MDTPISRAEHNEFVKRIEDENNRQNNRLRVLEDQGKQVTELAISVQKLATSIKQLADAQLKQNSKIESLEKRDGEMWRKSVGYVLTTILGAILMFLMNQVGIQ